MRLERAVVRWDVGPGKWCWWSARLSGTTGCLGGGPGALTVLSVLTSYRVSDKVALDVGHSHRVVAILFEGRLLHLRWLLP